MTKRGKKKKKINGGPINENQQLCSVAVYTLMVGFGEKL